MTAPYCVLAEIYLHLIEFILRQIWNVSSSKFKCISSKLLYDNSKQCLSRNSSASHRKYSEATPNCTLAEIQLHPIEVVLNHFQFLSWPKFNCILLKTIWDNSKLCLSRNSFAFHLNYSEALPYCVIAKIQLNLIEYFPGQYRIVS